MPPPRPNPPFPALRAREPRPSLDRALARQPVPDDDRRQLARVVVLALVAAVALSPLIRRPTWPWTPLMS